MEKETYQKIITGNVYLYEKNILYEVFKVGVSKSERSGTMQVRKANTFFTIDQHFFQKAIKPKRSKTTLSRYTHTLTPSRKLTKLKKGQTVHITLDENLELSLPNSTKKMLRRAEKEDYVVTCTTMPTKEQLDQFFSFYDAFAKNKKIVNLSSSNKNTIQSLLQQQAILFSSVANAVGQILCYRLDIIDGDRALSYFVATWPYPVQDQMKQQIKYANRYLWWHNLLYLKANQYVLYDAGNLTNNTLVAEFKKSFGGQVVDVYSGYVAHSTVGRMMLAFKFWWD